MAGLNLGTNLKHRPFLVAADLGKKSDPILDSASDDLPLEAPTDGILDAAAEDFGSALNRSRGMGIALTFIEDGDFLFDSVDDMVRGTVGMDAEGVEEPSEDEVDQYNDLSEAVLDSLISLGADQEQASVFLQGEDDAQGEVLGAFLTGEMDGNVLDDSTIINRFAVAETLEMEGDDGVLDAAKIKKIRNGRVVWVKKKIGPKKRMSAKQKAALKKARLKSNNGAAKAKRAKSSRIAKKMGL